MFGKLKNFGLFVAAEHGPLWRAFVADLEEAKMKAQQIAIDDGEGFHFQLQGRKRSRTLLSKTQA
jgi:hypothetical protein